MSESITARYPLVPLPAALLCLRDGEARASKKDEPPGAVGATQRGATAGGVRDLGDRAGLRTFKGAVDVACVAANGSKMSRLALLPRCGGYTLVRCGGGVRGNVPAREEEAEDGVLRGVSLWATSTCVRQRFWAVIGGMWYLAGSGGGGGNVHAREEAEDGVLRGMLCSATVSEMKSEKGTSHTSRKNSA